MARAQSRSILSEISGLRKCSENLFSESTLMPPTPLRVGQHFTRLRSAGGGNFFFRNRCTVTLMPPTPFRVGRQLEADITRPPAERSEAGGRSAYFVTSYGWGGGFESRLVIRIRLGNSVLKFNVWSRISIAIILWSV